MRKLIAATMSTLLILLPGCGAGPASAQSIPPSESQSLETSQSENGSGIGVEENLLTVDITLPASMFEDEDMTKFDEAEYLKETGFTAAKVNADGSVTVTMTKSKHKEVMADMEKQVEEAFSELVEGKDTMHIKEITHTPDFKTVTVKVDRAGYEAAVFDFTPFQIGLLGSVYQSFAGEEIKVTTVIKDENTGEEIQSFIFPDDTTK